MAEAESTKFIRNNTTIPVPRGLEACAKERWEYILMEFVEGELLEKAWPKLLSDERRVTMAELKDLCSPNAPDPMP
jgi:aminoglycoside phosphotransferase (APT) family kinase protein